MKKPSKLTRRDKKGSTERNLKSASVPLSHRRKSLKAELRDLPSGDEASSPNLATDDPFKEADKGLTRYRWFHGMMPRVDCEELVKAEGDFLVRRTTLAKVPTYCITVRHNGEAKHIPISYLKGIWSINQDSKATLGELLDMYVKGRIPIPPANSVLINYVERPEYFLLHSNIILGEKLGHGAFGEVYSGKLRLGPAAEVPVAVKRAKEGHMKKSQLNSFIREAKIMRRLDHPNIVRMYGVAPQEEPVMIILELAVNGSLKIIHRDLAARNCLLGAAYEVKISDFGLSVADKSELRLNKLQKVPVKWLSPETINEGVFTTKTDVWSFGVLMWEIFANCKSDPFPGETNAQAVSLITGKTPPMEPPPGSPLLVKQVMDLCFVKSPDARADFGALLHVLAPSEAPPAVAAKTSSSDLNVHVTKSSETCLAKTKQPLAKSVDSPLNGHRTKAMA